MVKQFLRLLRTLAYRKFLGLYMYDDDDDDDDDDDVDDDDDDDDDEKFYWLAQCPACKQLKSFKPDAPP